jgi:hypothetical protein
MKRKRKVKTSKRRKEEHRQPTFFSRERLRAAHRLAGIGTGSDTVEEAEDEEEEENEERA